MDSWSHRPFGLRSSRVPVTSTPRVSASSASSLLGSARLSNREMGLSSERFPRTSSTYKTDLEPPVSWTHAGLIVTAEGHQYPFNSCCESLRETSSNTTCCPPDSRLQVCSSVGYTCWGATATARCPPRSFYREVQILGVCVFEPCFLSKVSGVTDLLPGSLSLSFLKQTRRTLRPFSITARHAVRVLQPVWRLLGSHSLDPSLRVTHAYTRRRGPKTSVAPSLPREQKVVSSF